MIEAASAQAKMNMVVAHNTCYGMQSYIVNI
jgi:hypothetical protein